jgi:hypothetical protein
MCRRCICAGKVGEVAEPEWVGSPVPAPRQVFAIRSNCRNYAVEANLGIPDEPPVFTELFASLTGFNKRRL